MSEVVRLPLPAHRYTERAQPLESTDNTGAFAFDIDGVISAFPRQCETLISALTAAGRYVYIITGVPGDEVTPQDVQHKREFLNALGIGADIYHELIVLPQPHPENKAKAIQDLDVAVLVDNNKQNIQAAAPFCVALYLWNTRENGKPPDSGLTAQGGS